LHVLLDKRIKENDRLTEEWKHINNKYTDAESKLLELTVKLEEYASKEATIELREKQFQSDKQRLLNEIDWLNQQLTTKSSQILEIKGNFNQKVYDLETKLEDCLAEVSLKL
jgi:chromosome segregation ATPase